MYSDNIKYTRVEEGGFQMFSRIASALVDNLLSIKWDILVFKNIHVRLACNEDN